MIKLGHQIAAVQHMYERTHAFSFGYTSLVECFCHRRNTHKVSLRKPWSIYVSVYVCMCVCEGEKERGCECVRETELF